MASPTVSDRRPELPVQGRCLCPRGCGTPASPGSIYCMSCYAEAGADFRSGEKQPDCACTPGCCADVHYRWGAFSSIVVTRAELNGPLTPPPFFLSFTDLLSRRMSPGRGAKFANAEQRRLRTWCLLQQPRVHRVELTNSTWPWPDILRSMHQDVLQNMFVSASGDIGISNFCFRLLQGVPDSNYVHKDSGERHVFELRRADGTRFHLHYHKNGSMDKCKAIEADEIATQSQDRAENSVLYAVTHRPAYSGATTMHR